MYECFKKVEKLKELMLMLADFDKDLVAPFINRDEPGSSVSRKKIA
jgi:hypothetical protein